MIQINVLNLDKKKMGDDYDNLKDVTFSTVNPNDDEIAPKKAIIMQLYGDKLGDKHGETFVDSKKTTFSFKQSMLKLLLLAIIPVFAMYVSNVPSIKQQLQIHPNNLVNMAILYGGFFAIQVVVLFTGCKFFNLNK